MAQELTDEEHFCLEGCRSYRQYCGMRKRFESGSCVFCSLDRTVNEVLFEDEHAYCWSTPYPRDSLKHEYLIVPKRHVRRPWELETEELRSIHLQMGRIAEEIGFDGGILTARIGDMRLNAGTVPHLHYNLWQPSGTEEVRIPVFKDPAGRSMNRDRAERFAELYERNISPERFDQLVAGGVLSSDAQILDIERWLMLTSTEF